MLAVGRALAAEVSGAVLDPQGHPMQGLKLSALAPGGKIASTGVSSVRGEYKLFGLTPGTYTFVLDPLTTGLQGARAVAFVGNQGLTIIWRVSKTAVAIAVASQTKNPLEVPSSLVGALAGAGTASGVIGGSAAAGAFRGSSPRIEVVSPSM